VALAAGGQWPLGLQQPSRLARSRGRCATAQQRPAGCRKPRQTQAAASQRAASKAARDMHATHHKLLLVGWGRVGCGGARQRVRGFSEHQSIRARPAGTAAFEDEATFEDILCMSGGARWSSSRVAAAAAQPRRACRRVARRWHSFGRRTVSRWPALRSGQP
jgi:hypothetical protein